MKNKKLKNKEIKMTDELSAVFGTTKNLQKYILQVSIQESDKNGMCTYQFITKEYTNVNTSLLEARREAVSMAQNYYDVLESSNNFTPYKEIEISDFTNHSCYLISIYFVNIWGLEIDDCLEYAIHGKEIVDLLENLELEAEYFINHLPSESITLLELELDKKYLILNHDIDFILEEHLA